LSVNARSREAEEVESHDDQWVQCEKCDAWHTLTDGWKPEDLPDIWECKMEPVREPCRTWEEPESPPPLKKRPKSTHTKASREARAESARVRAARSDAPEEDGNGHPEVGEASPDGLQLLRSKTAKSGFVGVDYHEGRWRARIRNGAQRIVVARTMTAIEAATAYAEYLRQNPHLRPTLTGMTGAPPVKASQTTRVANKRPVSKRGKSSSNEDHRSPRSSGGDVWDEHEREEVTAVKPRVHKTAEIAVPVGYMKLPTCPELSSLLKSEVMFNWDCGWARGTVAQKITTGGKYTHWVSYLESNGTLKDYNQTLKIENYFSESNPKGTCP